jgi:hypothetical protein
MVLGALRARRMEIDPIEARALDGGEERPVYTRVGALDGRI